MTNTHPSPTITEYKFNNNHIYLTVSLSQVTNQGDKQIEEERTYVLTTDVEYKSKDHPSLVVNGTHKIYEITNNAVQLAGEQSIYHNSLNLKFLLDTYLEIDILYPVVKKHHSLIKSFIRTGMTESDKEGLLKDIDALSQLANKHDRFRSIFTEYKDFLTKQIDIIEQVRQIRRKNTIELVTLPNRPNVECQISFKEEEESTSLYISTSHINLPSSQNIPAFQLDATQPGWRINNNKSNEFFTSPYITTKLMFAHCRCIELQKDVSENIKIQDALADMVDIWYRIRSMFISCEESELYKSVLPYVTLNQAFALLVRMAMQEILTEIIEQNK